MSTWKNGDRLKYVGSMSGNLRLGLVKVFDASNPMNIGVEDETGLTWFVPPTDLVEPIPEKKTSKAEELVILKQGGFSTDDILRLNEAGLL